MMKMSQLLILILLMLQICGCNKVQQEEKLSGLNEGPNMCSDKQEVTNETKIVDFEYVYDLYEETVMDLLAEIPVELKKEINHIAVASDLSKALIECYKGEKVFVYNIIGECLTELGELTELEGADSAYFLKDDLLLVIDREGTDNRNFTVELYTYHFNTGEVVNVVERMPLYNQNYQPEGIELKGSDFALMYINNEIYKIDLLTGELELLDIVAASDV